MTYGQIRDKFHISRSSAEYIVKSFGASKAKTGMKSKINKSSLRDMVKESQRSFENNEKCSASDLKTTLHLPVSLSTVQRSLRYMKYTYTDIRRKFYLSHKSKIRRLEMAKRFIIDGTSWNSVIFSDEKLFTMNG